MYAATAPSRSRSKSWAARRAGALFVGGFGLVFGVSGALMLLIGVPGVLEHAGMVRNMPVVGPQVVADLPPGSLVLVEGRIADEQPTPHRDFVVGTRQEFRGWKTEGARRREQWTTLDVFTAPLAVATGSGVVRGINGDFEMRDERRVWQSSDSLTYEVLGGSTQRITGFGRGDAVVMEGVIESGAKGQGVRVLVLAGGDRVRYLGSLEASASTLTLVGGIFAGVGGLLFACGVIAILRLRRAATHA